MFSWKQEWLALYFQPRGLCYVSNLFTDARYLLNKGRFYHQFEQWNNQNGIFFITVRVQKHKLLFVLDTGLFVENFCNSVLSVSFYLFVPTSCTIWVIFSIAVKFLHNIYYYFYTFPWQFNGVAHMVTKWYSLRRLLEVILYYAK